MNNMDSNNVFTKERVYNIEDVEERNSNEKQGPPENNGVHAI